MMRSYILILCLFWMSCSDNKAEKTAEAPPPPPPKYYFYPRANVYFDTVNKEYVFIGNDGRTWITEKQIPAAMQGMMDKSVLLDSFSQPVWRDNEQHKLIYSAVLYASPNDTVEKKPVPVVSQKPVNPDTAVKKEKKGLRKLLDKIFGRKKKDNSN